MRGEGGGGDMGKSATSPQTHNKTLNAQYQSKDGCSVTIRTKKFKKQGAPFPLEIRPWESLVFLHHKKTATTTNQEVKV